MRYTEEDEQRVYEEINRAVAKEMRSPSRLPQDEFMRHIARVAVDAMERETLEDVLDNLSPKAEIEHVEWNADKGNWHAWIWTPRTGSVAGEGATRTKAIRNAVAAAKGEKA